MHSRVGVRSGRYCADFDRPRPRAAMASTLPDSISQLISHLRQVSWGMIQQNCFERKQILTRARPGGGYPPPLRFFADSEKTAARSAAKFAIAIQPTI